MDLKEKGLKKRKKYFVPMVLLILIVLVLLAAAAGFFLLGHYSDEKRQYEEQIRQATTAFTDGLIAELDQIDTSDEGIKNAESAQPEEGITESEQKMLTTELEKIDDARKRQVLKTLAPAYNKALQAQKQEAINQIEALIAQGKSEWAALHAAGKNTAADKGAFASEYMAKSRVLEGQVDASFHTLMAKMEEQLKAEGIDPAPIIKEYEAEYKRIKEENRSTLMDKAYSAIKN